MSFSKNNCIEINYGDGKRSVVRRDIIHAVTGDVNTTTLVFQGGNLEVMSSIENVLTVLGYQDAPEPTI